MLHTLFCRQSNKTKRIKFQQPFVLTGQAKSYNNGKWRNSSLNPSNRPWSYLWWINISRCCVMNSKLCSVYAHLILPVLTVLRFTAALFIYTVWWLHAHATSKLCCYKRRVHGRSSQAVCSVLCILGGHANA